MECILALTTLKTATWVAETCRRSLYNKIAFIKPSAFVGIFNKFTQVILVLKLYEKRQIDRTICRRQINIKKDQKELVGYDVNRMRLVQIGSDLF